MKNDPEFSSKPDSDWDIDDDDSQNIGDAIDNSDDIVSTCGINTLNTNTNNNSNINNVNIKNDLNNMTINTDNMHNNNDNNNVNNNNVNNELKEFVNDPIGAQSVLIAMTSLNNDISDDEKQIEGGNNIKSTKFEPTPQCLNSYKNRQLKAKLQCWKCNICDSINS